MGFNVNNLAPEEKRAWGEKVSASRRSKKTIDVGFRSGMLTVVEELPYEPGSTRLLRCRCDCGGERIAKAVNIRSRRMKSCGCLHTTGNKRPAPIGQRFGMLVVIKESERKGIAQRVVCQCDCGKIHELQLRALIEGKNKSCGCIKRTKEWGEEIRRRQLVRFPVIGHRSGRALVIGEVDTPARTPRRVRCRCDCGTEFECQWQTIRKGETQSCGCYARERRHEVHFTGVGRLSGSYWNKLVSNAKLRGIVFRLTKEYLWDLFRKQEGICALSGVQLQLSRGKDDGEQTASVDRVDSSVGYVPGNVQWVHKDLNKMKLDHSQEGFIEWCRLVANRNEPKMEVAA